MGVNLTAKHLPKREIESRFENILSSPMFTIDTQF